ncbi:MAG: TIGR04222 domain-containing membrane protein [Micromonosporaceae bacterium]
MGSYAQAGPTWGIDGPTFLLVYAVLAGVSLIAVAMLRQRALTTVARRDPTTPRTLRPTSVAYLAGGEEYAIVVSLVMLRCTGSVAGNESGELVSSGDAPAGASRLELAAHRAVREGATTRDQVWRHSAVFAELAGIRRRLRKRGLLLSQAARRRARLASLWLLPVICLGTARAVAGILNGRPIGFLVALILATLAVGLYLVRTPADVTPAGRRVLDDLRADNFRLSPKWSPALATYGPRATGLAVALFGGAALMHADRDVAEASGGALSGGFGGGHHDLPFGNLSSVGPYAPGSYGGDLGGDLAGSDRRGCGG